MFDSEENFAHRQGKRRVRVTLSTDETFETDEDNYVYDMESRRLELERKTGRRWRLQSAQPIGFLPKQ